MGDRFVPVIALAPRRRFTLPGRLGDVARSPMGAMRRNAMERRRRPHPRDLPPTATGTRRSERAS